MKIRISELRKVIRTVLREMHEEESPFTQRSPDTSREVHPETLEMMNDAEPETEVSPGTQASPGMTMKNPDDEINTWLRGDDESDDEAMASTQLAPTGYAKRSSWEDSPFTVRSPRRESRKR